MFVSGVAHGFNVGAVMVVVVVGAVCVVGEEAEVFVEEW